LINVNKTIELLTKQLNNTKSELIKERQDLIEVRRKEGELRNLVATYLIKLNSVIELLENDIEANPYAGKIIRIFRFLQDRIKEELGPELNQILPSHDIIKIFNTEEEVCETKEVGINTDLGYSLESSNCVIEIDKKKDIKIQVREKLLTTQFPSQLQTIKKNNSVVSQNIQNNEDVRVKLTAKFKTKKLKKLNYKPYNILKSNAVKVLLDRNTIQHLERCKSVIKYQHGLNVNKSLLLSHNTPNQYLISKSINNISNSVF